MPRELWEALQAALGCGRREALAGLLSLAQRIPCFLSRRVIDFRSMSAARAARDTLPP